MARRGDVVRIRDDSGATVPALIVRWSGRLGSPAILLDGNAHVYRFHVADWVEARETPDGPLFANGDRAHELAARLTEVLHSNRGRQAMAALRASVTRRRRRGTWRVVPLPDRDPSGGRGHLPNGQAPVKVVTGFTSNLSGDMTRYLCRHEREIKAGTGTQTIEVRDLPEIDLSHLAWLQERYPQYYAVYLAHHLGGESYRVVAEKHGITEAVARRRQQLANQKLRAVRAA